VVWILPPGTANDSQSKEGEIMKTTRLAVSGMSCGHCADTVKNALLNQTGVRNATVHLESGTAEVQYEEREVIPEQLIAAVSEEGYPATVAGGDVAGQP
jgi:copper chaperone CopZ